MTGDNGAATKQIRFSAQGFEKSELEKFVYKIKNLGFNDCRIREEKNAFIIVIGTYSYLDFINFIKRTIT